jgi:hypothetical protein
MPEADDMLRGYLADRDEPCPGCAYNLRALTGSRCPECNQELTLRVGLVEQKLAWFITGLAGIAMPTGFCAILACYAFARVVRMRGSGPPMWQVWLILIGAVIGLAVLIAWIRARRRVGRAPPQTRWVWCAVAIGVSLVCPIAFLCLVR